MIISCDSCEATLQLDESKAPSDNFTIRCPKCSNLVRVRLSTAGGYGNGGHALKPNNQTQPPAPAVEQQHQSWEPPQPAAVYKLPEGADDNHASVSTSAENNELLKLLAGLIKQSGGDESEAVSRSFNSQSTTRRVLLCLAPDQRETAARSLSEADYEIHIAESATQALETMRETKIGIVVFSQHFAAQHNGAGALLKNINGMSANERRDLFAVAVDDSLQTFNAHEAFLRNLNLIVHQSDLRNLSHVLKRALREFDDLYRDFSRALAA